jgi:hypothetical protein
MATSRVRNLNFFFAVVAAGLSAFLGGCQAPIRDGAKPRIIGGEDAGQDTLTWIVRMSIDGAGLCTGSFVSPTTLITASHCVRSGSKVFIPRYEVSSVKVVEFPGTTDKVEQNDLAIVLYPPHTAKKWSRISSSQPKVGEKVNMLGYGSCTEWNGPDSGTRRCRGTNKITSLGVNQGFIRTEQSNGVTVSPGDSGGPMYRDDESIVGIASGGGYGQDSLHVNLFLKENIEWMKDVVTQHQAVICGLDGVNDPVCQTSSPGGGEDPVDIPAPVE